MIVFIFIYFSNILIKSDKKVKTIHWWVNGIILESDYKIKECINNLWVLRKEVDNYYIKNKKFPINIEDIFKISDNKKIFLCPVHNKKYIMKLIDNKSVICCPNPENHGVDEVYFFLEGGPPVIERSDFEDQQNK